MEVFSSFGGREFLPTEDGMMVWVDVEQDDDFQETMVEDIMEELIFVNNAEGDTQNGSCADDVDDDGNTVQTVLLTSPTSLCPMFWSIEKCAFQDNVYEPRYIFGRQSGILRKADPRRKREPSGTLCRRKYRTETNRMTLYSRILGLMRVFL